MAEDLRQTTARGFFLAALGGGVQQIVTLLIGIALARLLSISDYGMVGMLTVFSLLAGNLQESGFTATLAVRRDARREDYSAVFWFSTVASSCIYALLFVGAPYIAAYNNTPALTLYARVIFLGFVVSSFGTASTAMLFRQMQVRERTTSQVAASMLSGVVGLTMAFFDMGCWSLVGMDLSYKLTYTTLVNYFAHWRPYLMTPSEVWGRIRPLLPQSVNILATNVLTTLSGQLIQGLLGHRYPLQSVGHYAQAQKWQTLGQQLLSGMVGSVAQPVLGRVNDDRDRQQRVLLTLLRFTAFMSFPAMMGLAYVSPQLIPMLIGDKWAACVPLLQMLCIAGSTVPLSQTLANLVIAQHRSGVFLLVSSMMLALQLAAYVLLSSYGIHTLVLVLASITLMALPVWALVVKALCRIRLRGVARSVLPYAAVALLSIGVSRWLGCEDIWLRIPVVAVAYVGGLALFRDRTLREAWEFVRR